MINLKNRQYSDDFGPLEEGCKCPVCRPKAENGMGMTRAMVSHLASKETAGAHLLTLHNVYYQLNLMRTARQAILRDEYPEFVARFFSDWYGGDRSKYPEWAVEALKTVEIYL